MRSGNQRNQRGVVGAGAILGILGAVLHFAGCGLSTEGTLQVSGNPCDTSQQCDDMNACTDDECSDQKFCSNTPKTGGGPDDANDCTTDACTAGVESHDPEANGTSCKAGAGTGLCTKGACIVACGGPGDPANICDDMNPCTTDNCDLGTMTCDHGVLNGPEPGVTPVKGDCKTALCVAGVPKVVDDNTDLPDAVDCKMAVCAAGVLTVTNLAAEVACGAKGTLKCDGKGTCANCASAADCTVPNTCQIAACTGGSCIPNFAAAGKVPADQQTPNDCSKVVCDGAGNANPQPDPTDLPLDDGNPCTTETCSGDVPVHDPGPNIGKACPSGVCDVSGICVQCIADTGCDDNSKCTTDSCTSEKCVHVTITCNDGNVCTDDSCAPASGCVYKNNTSACSDGNACTTGDVCGGGTCAGTAMNCSSPPTCQKSASPSCNGGVCQYTADNTASCSDGNACTTDVCSGGSCNSTPITCAPPPTCQKTGSPFCTGGVCQYAPDNSASCSDGNACTTDVCNGGSCNSTPITCTAPYTCSNGTCGSCGDGVKNGNEAGVDCNGGPSCPLKCKGDMCTVPGDCESNMCSGTPMKCQ